MFFVKSDNLVVFHRKLNIEQEFSMFRYEDENSMLTYRMIENRSETGYFISEVKNIDYLLHIQGDLVMENISEFVTRLNSLDAIRMCVPVDLGKIRERDRLHLW